MSDAARRYFGCFLPIVLLLAGCGVAAMAAYGSRVAVEARAIPDGAMEPWLPAGGRALVFHVTLWASDPERGIVVDADTPAGRTFRRLVALPGDRVEVRDGRLLIDGRPSDPARRPEGTGPDYGPVTLGPDEHFLLSDMRAFDDSRVWGPLPRSRLFGEPRFADEGDGWLSIDSGIDRDWLDVMNARYTATAAAATAGTVAPESTGTPVSAAPFQPDLPASTAPHAPVVAPTGARSQPTPAPRTAP